MINENECVEVLVLLCIYEVFLRDWNVLGLFWRVEMNFRGIFEGC